MRKSVVVVDDDKISRRGIAELLADRPEIEVVGALDHDQALAWDLQWNQVDVALVDASDDRREDDQFPGVGVVEHIRQRRAPHQTVVIVLTGHFFDDAVRRRMREARADYFYRRSDLDFGTALEDAVIHPDRARAGVPPEQDTEALFQLGVVATSRVNAGVSQAKATGIQSFSRTRSRRQERLRRKEFNAAARLNTVNADGAQPNRGQDTPSTTQIGKFLNWATRVKTPHR
jgi:CheY-like chemotaxis protein